MSDTPRTDAALVPFIAVTKGELIGELVRADDMRELERENAALIEALVEFDALIKHQYTGTREAMSDLHYAAQAAAKVLAAMEKATLQANP